MLGGNLKQNSVQDSLISCFSIKMQLLSVYINPMARKKDLINTRLNAISSAKPALFSVPQEASTRQKASPREERKAVYWQGSLEVGSRQKLACIIRDISSSGARISIQGACRLPEKIVLRCANNGVVKSARVVWYDNEQAGVVFLADLTRSLS